ncbi:outer membrane protein transport protein [Reichenbachiella agarivorans]|uniref:Outer membrane protein transport protein n=1 Tax=Reichenbachiella agarivorans TaxID=2979464 RepID=A0ABY6CV73_9BACT|nr:outer membrane protein transport protein [Reichenbachiella agarivorans]UXP33283.1 outer membrane protein transport protein [Reichenbachiella agarivorans]
MSHQMSMGGVGIATPSFYHVNNLNPALLTYNTLSVFELGLQGESRTAASALDKQTTGSGGFKYLSFAFPILYDRLTTNLGVRPYSTVNYNFATASEVNGNPDVSSFSQRTGEGGITEVYWSNGVKIFDNLSLGVTGSFLFGLILDEEKTLLLGDDLPSQVPSGVLEKTNYKGYRLGFGAAYEFELAEKRSLHVGATYDLANSLEGDRLVRQVTYVASSTLPGDTLTNLSFKSAFDMPAEFGFGISYEYHNRLKVGLDLNRNIWKKDAAFGDFSRQEYRSTYKAAIGVEFIPKYNDVDSYMSRVRYRFGLNYEQLPYLVGSNKIDDFGITFGWSLPVKSVSALNMAFQYGQRGTKDDGLVKESYFKFNLGVTLNDRWFIRRKYN